ncbi:hypothetical protein QM797_08960 [Rhodococcus sp. IEGM 1381]|uniref:hypothetical protein n=1 Tax=Rhodococcus sp. IEGM 1381 TaxID=3047085 RepID=UPI0024B663D6|nr:hypothetical protein [Rhodococcus sp. IEGM 1381]MDI9894853.1 hypothetical protein [Rhodococcus sp. IEGM 1381]
MSNVLFDSIDTYTAPADMVASAASAAPASIESSAAVTISIISVTSGVDTALTFKYNC